MRQLPVLSLDMAGTWTGSKVPFEDISNGDAVSHMLCSRNVKNTCCEAQLSRVFDWQFCS